MAKVNADSIHGAGLKKLVVVDPVEQLPLDAAAFFPSPQRTGITTIGPYRIAASGSAPIGKDRYPLILISHGNMGSMWGHHDLASFLAQHGYIVITVTHPGDNFRDTSRVGSSSAIYGRPMQISAALTAAVEDPVLAPHIEPAQVGFIGFSAGGTTGLILAGAKPIFSRLEDYCATRLNDHHVCEARGQIAVDRPELAPSADPRIRSFVLLAPVSVVFPPDELKRLTAPTLVYVGEKDKALSPADNAMALVRDMRSDVKLQVIPSAGHFTFLAPCSPELIRAEPALCVDHRDIDRTAIHRDINAGVEEFFATTLGSATPSRQPATTVE